MHIIWSRSLTALLKEEKGGGQKADSPELEVRVDASVWLESRVAPKSIMVLF